MAFVVEIILRTSGEGQECGELRRAEAGASRIGSAASAAA